MGENISLAITLTRRQYEVLMDALDARNITFNELIADEREYCSELKSSDSKAIASRQFIHRWSAAQLTLSRLRQKFSPNQRIRLPFQSHSASSRLAAEAVRGVAPSLREQVWLWLSECGPATDGEMQSGLSMRGSTQRPRRIELFRAGRIEEAGFVEQSNGRLAMSWKVVNDASTSA